MTEDELEMKAITDAIAIVGQLQFMGMVGLGLNENLHGDDYARLAGETVKPKKKWWRLFILLAFLPFNAQASTYNSHVQALYSPQLIDAIIKDQIRKHPMDMYRKEAFSIHDSPICIDGEHEAIDISYVQIPIKEKVWK